MRNVLTIAALLLIPGGYSFAQVAPAATSGGANLSYSLRYAQNAQFGGSLGNWQSASPSGSAGYSNGRTDRPFSLTYSGGYTWTIKGPSYASGFFQRMFLSQGWNWRTWNLQVGDNVNYTPQSPTTGFSGIPGIGEPIGTPSPTPPSSLSIQTLGAHVVLNDTTVGVGHVLNYALSMNMGGGWEIARFVDSNGLNTDSRNANGGLTYRMTARSSLTGQYSYMQYAYPDFDFSFQVNAANFSYQRTWTRAISTSVSAGPSWVSSGQSTANTPQTMPSSTLVNANAALSYAFRSGSAAVMYSRGTSGGSGYLLGAVVDTVSGTYSHPLQKETTFEMTGGYRRTSGLASVGTYNSEFGAVQATRKLGRYMSAFANYTVTTQSSNTAVPSNVLNNMLQGVSFGIGYSRETNPVR